MSKWIPDRKVWAGGVFAVLAYVAILASNQFLGTDIPLDAGAFLAIAIGKAAEYVIPPSVRDVIKRLDDDLVAIAGASPASDVSREVGKAAQEIASHHETFDALAGRMRG